MHEWSGDGDGDWRRVSATTLVATITTTTLRLRVQLVVAIVVVVRVRARRIDDVVSCGQRRRTIVDLCVVYVIDTRRKDIKENRLTANIPEIRYKNEHKGEDDLLISRFSVR